MRYLVVTGILFLLSSCSTSEKQLTYDPAKNCSPRGLNKVLEGRGMPNADQLKETEKLRAEFKNAVPALRECYLNALEDSSKRDPHIACVVMETSDVGGLTFLDIEDNTNPLPKEMQQCMIDVFSKVSFKGIKKAIITQPLGLQLRKE